MRDVAAANEILPWLASSGDHGTLMFTGGIVLGPGDRLVAILEETVGDVTAADRHFVAAIEVSRRIASPFGSVAAASTPALDAVVLECDTLAYA